MRFRFSQLILIASLAASAMASANEGGLKFDDVRSQQSEIRAGIVAKSGRYRDLPESTRVELLTRQTRVLSAIDGKQNPDELTQVQRTEVFNDLEWIEAAVNRTEDDRLVCEYTKTIGSNRRTRVCRTEEQIREARERAKEELDQAMRHGS
jgi:hypothetical protein